MKFRFIRAIRRWVQLLEPIAFVFLWITPAGWAQNSAQTEFFESKIRPVLVTRCGACHGGQVQMGGIQLTSKEAFERSNVVIAGDVESSRLIQALRHGGKVKMPPSGRLASQEIEAIERWVAQGASWPETAPNKSDSDLAGHWAFKPVTNPPPPIEKIGNWARSDIDRFVLSRLEEKNLAPAPDADKYTLLRRLTLDLTGLLPTAGEIAEFQNDTSDAALERVVDRLLASPAYGDRWGRHWLDVTYWADTTGVGRRIPLREAWRYRDYVIASFNDDKPFPTFIREQIAGITDEPKGSEEGGAKAKNGAAGEHAAATGFLVIGPWAWFSYDKAQLRLDVADLQVDLVGRTFLGLTLGCARCHDHKFDPIPNKDYYGMAGIFLSTKTLASSNVNGGISTVQLPQTLADIRRYADDLEKWEKQVAEVEEAAAAIKAEQAEINKSVEKWKSLPPDEETEAQLWRARERLAVLSKKAGSAPDRQIAPFTRYMKPRLAEVYAAEDMEFPEHARIAVRGDAHQLGQVAPRGFLSAITDCPQPEIPPHTSGRKELAAWIADVRNPLTSRVYVNRIWHHLFGRGIVPTTDNFGLRGELPSHPELLDYLARRFTANGWSTKKAIKEIVLSRTYRIASHGADPKAMEVDPDNKLLWRSNRRRLEVEAIRDTILQASGMLDSARSGPSLPLTAQNVHTIAPFFLEEDSVVEDHVRYRRTVYQPIMRGGQMTDLDILNLFDFADPDQVVGARAQTMVPSQALYLMNSPFIKEQARSLAQKLLNNSRLDDESRVSSLIMETLNRPATVRDVQQARQFLSDFRSGSGDSTGGNGATVEAWARYCHAIFASSEFLYRR
jgi:mono/diheme cytochrome c family protein